MTITSFALNMKYFGALFFDVSEIQWSYRMLLCLVIFQGHIQCDKTMCRQENKQNMCGEDSGCEQDDFFVWPNRVRYMQSKSAWFKAAKTVVLQTKSTFNLYTTKLRANRYSYFDRLKIGRMKSDRKTIKLEVVYSRWHPVAKLSFARISYQRRGFYFILR